MRPSPSCALPVAVLAGLALAGPATAVPRQAHEPAPSAPVAADARPSPLVAVSARPITRGRGRTARLHTRIDTIDAAGVRRRVVVLSGGGLFDQPSLSPDGRSVALARVDGRIAVVSLRDGRVRRLSPALPRGAAEHGGIGRAPDGRWAVDGSGPVAWSPDGRLVYARLVVLREPARLASQLIESRSVACVVASGRCTPADETAPADLLPLGPGRALRLDGPLSASTPAEDSVSSTSGFGARQLRTILGALRRPVATGAEVSRTANGTGPGTVLRRLRGSTGAGVTGLGIASPGPAGVLVRRTETRLGRDEERPFDGDDDGPSVAVRTRVLRPWLISPAGLLRTLPLRLAVDPIGALDDGRWLLPTARVTPSRSAGDLPEPELATLDARGAVRRLPVGGRPLTPVRLALESGLPDDFAVGAAFGGAWSRGGDLLVVLRNSGSDGITFFPADGALVRVPLDGSTPARLVDHRSGASYAVR